MGRTLGSKNKPKEDAGVGHNSEPGELTAAQRKSLLMQACREVEPLKSDVASLVGSIRAIYKRFKADGIPKKDIDLMLRLHGLNEESAGAEASRYLEIFEWTHPGVQAELFAEAAQ